jgi:hypothetical protein
MFMTGDDLSDICNIARKTFDLILLKYHGKDMDSIIPRYDPMTSICGL